MFMRAIRFAPLILVLLFATVAPAMAQTTQRCFPETGFCIAGAIRAYWERGGGLPVFGFPITTQNAGTVEGQAVQIQWFERDRLELHGDGSVTAGRLGAERLEQLGTPFQQGPSEAAGAGCRVFAETGYQVCGVFANYWQKNNGLQRFGLPLTAAISATINGQALTVQYFERRRFETHGDVVQLGLLGREVLEGQGEQIAIGQPADLPVPQTPAPAPQPTAAPTNSGSVPAVDAYTCPADHDIKGNINSRGEKIYHTRASRSYPQTKPEECFATEADAQAAGYRAARD